MSSSKSEKEKKMPKLILSSPPSSEDEGYDYYEESSEDENEKLRTKKALDLFGEQKNPFEDDETETITSLSVKKTPNTSSIKKSKKTPITAKLESASHIDKNKEKEVFNKLSALFSKPNKNVTFSENLFVKLDLISKYSDLSLKSNNLLIPFIKASRHQIVKSSDLKVNETYIIVLSGKPGNNINRVFICQCSDINETEAIFTELLFKTILTSVSLDLKTEFNKVEKLTLLNIDIVSGEISNTIKQHPNFTVTIYGSKKNYNKSSIQKAPSDNSIKPDSNLKADSGGKKKTIRKRKNTKSKTIRKRKNIKKRKNTKKRDY